MIWRLKWLYVNKILFVEEATGNVEAYLKSVTEYKN
jgi:hypothetical protein